MGVPTSEIGYTSAMPRREDHEVRKGHVGHWIKKKNSATAMRHTTCKRHIKRALTGLYRMAGLGP